MTSGAPNALCLAPHSFHYTSMIFLTYSKILVLFANYLLMMSSSIASQLCQKNNSVCSRQGSSVEPQLATPTSTSLTSPSKRSTIPGALQKSPENPPLQDTNMKLMKTQGASDAMQMAHYKLTIIIIIIIIREMSGFFHSRSQKEKK